MKNGRKEGDGMKHFFVLPFYGPVAGSRNAPPGLHRSVVGSVAARAKNGFKPAHCFKDRKGRCGSALHFLNRLFSILYAITKTI